MNLGQSTYHCSICLVRENPVETLSGTMIAKVIERGRPTPPLPLLAKECRYKGKAFTRRFKSENYMRYNWLSGCELENKLFCWPCFVFSSDPSDTWGYKGFDGLSNFSNSVKTHMNQELHLLNVEKYNCYAPKEKAILVTPDTAGHHLGNRRRFDAAATLVAPPVETMTVEDEDDDDCEIIPHSEVLVELIEGDDPREPDSDARESCDMSQPSAAGAEKYQLKWHSHQQNLNSSISCLYRNDRYADVTLITCNNEENFTIPAHKLVLGTSSTYFANIFDKNITPPHAMTYIVLPPELTRRAIQTLIQYMYTGESTVSADILNEVLRGGEILKIRGLWRNQGAGGSSDGAAAAEQLVQKNLAGRHRTERVSVDRVPLQEPRLAQNPMHDSPVIVTNSVKSYGISQNAQMPASSSTPVINVKKDVAIDPGERCSRSDGQYEGHSSGVKRSLPQSVNQENNHQDLRQHSTHKASPSRTALVSAEDVPAGSSMPEALNFLNVKEEPVEWSDVNAEEIQLGRKDLSMVKVEMKESGSTADDCGSQDQEQIYSPLTCELCSETFTVPAEWVRHIESHTDPPHTVAKRRRRVEDNDDADITAALKCDLCAMYFVTPAEWVRHVQSTHTETELAMSNNSSTTSTSRRSTKPVVPSEQHPMVSTSLATTSTQQQQSQEKACPICNKSFPSYASMIIHKRTHTGERPFYCDICNKGFNVKSNLLRHMRTLHNQQGSQSPGGDPDSHGSD
ncbi:GDNF-inducible zinc finger protein 1 isoform X3 [Culex pipiens pallens]|nr:GDNF-inducible zinc finger protein 1 isoform X3 [Culex pipiens pallens]